MVLFLLQNETAPMSKPETNHPEIEPFVTKSVILSRKKDVMNPKWNGWYSNFVSSAFSLNPRNEVEISISADRKWRQQLNYGIELI